MSEIVRIYNHMLIHFQGDLHLLSQEVIEILLLKFDDKTQEEFEQFVNYYNICESYLQEYNFGQFNFQEALYQQAHGKILSEDLFRRRVLFIKFLEQKLRIFNIIDARKVKFSNFSKIWICHFCKREGHFTEDGRYTKDLKICNGFLSSNPIQRLLLIKKEKICVYCLNPDFHLYGCLNRAKCSICGNEHHHLICNFFKPF